MDVDDESVRLLLDGGIDRDPRKDQQLVTRAFERTAEPPAGDILCDEV